MKNSKSKNLAIAVAAVVALGGIGTYWAYNTVNSAKNDAENEMNSFISKLQTQLPPGFTQKNVIDKNSSGMFNTKGVYTLTYIDPEDTNFKFDYDISYVISHGISDYSSKHYPINGKAVLKSDKLTKYNLNNYSSVITGSVDSTTFSMNFKNDPINIEVDESENGNVSLINIKADASTSNLSYNKAKNTLHVNYIYPKINLTSQDSSETSSFDIKNLQFTHNGNIEQLTLDNSLLEVDIEELKDDSITIKGINVKSQIENLDNKYNFINNVIANSIVYKEVPEEEVSFAISTSINNVEKSPVNLIIDTYKKIDENNPTLTAADEAKIKENAINILKSGLDINVNKFLFMSKEITAEGSAQFTLKEAKSISDISIANNSTFKADVKINSTNQDYIQYLKSVDTLGYKHPKTTDDTYYFNILFDKNKLVYNLTDISGTPHHTGLLFTLSFFEEALKSNL